MKVFSNQTSKEQRRLWAIFTPSVTSLVLSFLVVLIVVGGIIFVTVYKTSGAPQFISALNNDTTNKSLTHVYGSTTNFLNGNSAFSDAPLAIFWALVGVGVYALVISLSSLLRNLSEAKRETRYMHIDKDEFRRVTLLRLLLRLFVIVLAWFVLEGIVKYLLPYTVAAAHIAAQNVSVQSIVYAIGAIVTIYVSVHLLVVMTRLVWLRVRLFS
jgi:hypothetical protein